MRPGSPTVQPAPCTRRRIHLVNGSTRRRSRPETGTAGKFSTGQIDIPSIFVKSSTTSAPVPLLSQRWTALAEQQRCEFLSKALHKSTFPFALHLRVWLSLKHSTTAPADSTPREQHPHSPPHHHAAYIPHVPRTARQTPRTRLRKMGGGPRRSTQPSRRLTRLPANLDANPTSPLHRPNHAMHMRTREVLWCAK